MPELYRARQAVVWGDSEPALLVQAQEVQRQEQGAQAPGLQVLYSPHWVWARPCLRMILQSSRRLEQSIKQLRSPTRGFMECRCYNSILGRRVSDLLKPLLRDRVSLSSSKTNARIRK